ncbi:MAG: hypothetical protein L0229_17825 [Blastocatellia bacterium]|nr:hypothetical protein [Blastocatellia bacterium]
MRTIKPAVVLLLIAIAAMLQARAFAQDDEENGPEQAASLIREAIKARGGDAYLQVRTLVSHGQYTPFAKGAPGLPQEFVDTIVYPETERTEFSKGKTKFIQTNSGDSGWIYDAQQKMIRDQTEEQVKRFQQGMRHDIDNVLRRIWKEPGVKLVFIGRREVWRNTFSHAVRIESKDGESVTLHFDLRSHLPLMMEYKSVGEEGTTNDQVRYARWVSYQGIMFPAIQDFYREGQQSARVAYDSVRFNENVPDKLFVKPTDIKEVK